MTFQTSRRPRSRLQASTDGTARVWDVFGQCLRVGNYAYQGWKKFPNAEKFFVEFMEEIQLIITCLR